MKREVDIVVLSDVQLGSDTCKGKELLNYLKSIKIGTLILNGDFISFAKLRKKQLPKIHLEIIQRVLKLASKGTKVYYITGDQDAALKKYTNFQSGNLHVRDNLQLQLKGKSYWLFHGDVLDFTLLGPAFGINAHQYTYRQLVKYNNIHRKISRLFGFTSFQRNTTKTSNYIQQFEDKVLQLASYHSCDYIICGHTRYPQMKTAEMNGKKVTYLNAGDWQSNLTALEYKWGRWSIFEYDPADYQDLYKEPHLKHDEFALDFDAKDYGSTQIIQDLLKIGKPGAAR
jgi:UDP-2,3-diacylglucosamine pyrophosphatase LpxH